MFSHDNNMFHAFVVHRGLVVLLEIGLLSCEQKHGHLPKNAVSLRISSIHN